MDNARAFAAARDEMTMPPISSIMPAEVNGVNGPSANMSAFARAATNDVKPQGPQIMMAAADPSMDKQRLANDAIGVGQSLKEPAQGMQTPESDAKYLGRQVMDAAAKVTTGMLGILSDEHAGNDMNGNGVPDDLEATPAARPAAPQIGMMPSMSGMGGM